MRTVCDDEQDEGGIPDELQDGLQVGVLLTGDGLDSCLGFAGGERGLFLEH